MADTRFLIGGGENLSENTARAPKKPGKKAFMYSVADRQRELAPQWDAVSRAAGALPDSACPAGKAVIAITLHPSFLARTHYPETLLAYEHLRAIGSRLVQIAPKKPRPRPGRSNGVREVEPTAELFVSLLREDIGALKSDLARLPEVSDFSDAQIKEHPVFGAAQDYRKIERVAPLGNERIKQIPDEYRHKGAMVPAEAILHASIDKSDDLIRSGFLRYAKELGLSVSLDRARVTGGLTFIPFYAPYELLDKIVGFSFLRALRRVPSLGRYTPATRSLGAAMRVQLPETSVAHEGLRVAIFDGGLPENHGLEHWVTKIDAPGVGAPDAAAQEHGIQVTSAFLFGQLSSKETAEIPIAKADHFRVLDDKTTDDDFQLYTVRERIERVLANSQYDFVNISLGPSVAMLDDDVDPWTATLDKIFSTGRTLCTVACGNEGEADPDLHLNRIQPPSDGVNVVGVGAADNTEFPWNRAPYSCVGLGRSPGIVKPDIVAFGGTAEQPFLAWAGKAGAKGTAGTSFAAPLALRMAAGLRAQFEANLWAPTVKALLVHRADPKIGEGPKAPKHPRKEVGWGRIPHKLEDIVLCGDGEARVVYQVRIPPRTGKRLYIPVPPGLDSKVKIGATICLYSDVDPEDSANYTRLGLDVIFRPHINKFSIVDGRQSQLPKTAEFFFEVRNGCGG